MAETAALHRTISGHLLREARLTRRDGHTGAVTLIQRFGSALATADLQVLVQRIAARLGRMLERRGLIERDGESAWLSGDPGEAGALDDLIGHLLTYRIAVCPRAGLKVFTLQSIAAQPERAGHHGAAAAGGFSLHAGLQIQPDERATLKRLCCYVSRLPVATERLALMPSGQVPPPRIHLTRCHGVFGIGAGQGGKEGYSGGL